MNIYDVLVNTVASRTPDLMCEKFRIFSEMKSLMETQEEFLNSDSINKVIIVLENILVFNIKNNSEDNEKSNEDSNGNVIVVEPHIKKDINELNLLMVKLAIKELNRTLDSGLKKEISNKLLRVGLNECTPKNVTQLIVDNKNNISIDVNFIKNYYWLKIKPENLKMFEDVLIKSLSYNDVFSVINENNYRGKPIGNIWFYTCYLVSKNKESLKLEDFKNFIEKFDMFSKNNQIKYNITEDLFILIFKTLENLKKNLDNPLNQEILYYDLISYNENLFSSIYKIFSKDSFTKKECLLVAEYLVKKDVSFIEQAFINMDKNIENKNSIITDFNFSQLENISKIVQVIKKLGIELTVEDYTSIALVSTKEDTDIILNFATKEGLQNKIVNTGLKSKSIKF